MGRYQKRPVEIEAVQFTGDNWREINKFVGKTFSDPDGGEELHWGFCPFKHDNLNYTANLWVQANEQWLPIRPGEWIIKDSLGFYPCQEAKFAELYDEVSEAAGVEDYDEKTLNKVRNILDRVGSITMTGDDILNQLQNEGILFRERP